MALNGSRFRCLVAFPPAVACGGSFRALPCLGQLGPQKSVRELSARAGAPRAAGVGASGRDPDPARDPGPPAHPARSQLGRTASYNAYLAPPRFFLGCFASWRLGGLGGRAPETPPVGGRGL